MSYGKTVAISISTMACTLAGEQVIAKENNIGINTESVAKSSLKEEMLFKKIQKNSNIVRVKNLNIFVAMCQETEFSKDNKDYLV